MPVRLAIDLRPLLEPFESGVTLYTCKLVQELKRRSYFELDLFYQAHQKCEHLHRVFPEARYLSYSNRFFHLKWLMGLRKLPEHYFPTKPDLIWIPDRRPFYETDVPLVMTVHDSVPEKLVHTLSLKSRIWHRLFPLRSLLKPVSGVLVPSLTSAAQLPRTLPKEVSYEGAHLSSKPNIRLPKTLSIPYFLLIAPADPRKRINWFLEMAEANPRVQFVWIGLKEGDRRFARFFKFVPQNVLILKQVDEALKTTLLKKAAALLALSVMEGFDLPVLEAVKAKCPVILSDIPVHRELYKEAIFIKNTTELKLAIYQALQGQGKVPKPRGVYTWRKAAERASLFFLRVLLHKDRQSSGHRNG